MFPLAHIAHIGVSPSINLKVISREIIFDVFHATCVKNIPVRHRRSDGQTNGQAVSALTVA